MVPCLSCDVSMMSPDCHNKCVGGVLILVFSLSPCFFSLFAGEAEEEDQRRSVGGCERA